ncbi:hypothetical protein [Marinobacterium jannaschii]|uniref:hypothetical protein n=1 Tax=Marinobacterium jannaschii TaxID=64970 RepID=UPI001471F640|nr:hypothetical protein [Marinobacterium jannaschii]
MSDSPMSAAGYALVELMNSKPEAALLHNRSSGRWILKYRQGCYRPSLEVDQRAGQALLDSGLLIESYSKFPEQQRYTVKRSGLPLPVDSER